MIKRVLKLMLGKRGHCLYLVFGGEFDPRRRGSPIGIAGSRYRSLKFPVGVLFTMLPIE